MSLSDGKKKAKVKNKGTLNNQFSSYLLEYLEGYQIPTHLVELLSDCEMLVKRLEIIPEGLEFPRPILEHYLRSDHLPPPLLNE